MVNGSSVRTVGIGISADDTLRILGKPLRAEVLERGEDGFIVKWVYGAVILTLKRGEEGGVMCYRIMAIERT